MFHDATLDRLTGERGALVDVTAGRLAALRYADGSGVLTFAELLDRVAGAAPLLVEVKSEWTAPDD
ncbi:hypothetical protein, partial [Pseudomonas aeruginosa]